MSSIAGQTVARIRTHCSPVVNGSEPITRFGVDNVAVRLIGKRTEQSTVNVVAYSSTAGAWTIYNAVVAATGTQISIVDSDAGITETMIATGVSPARLSTAVLPGTQIAVKLEFDVVGYKQ